MPLIENVMRIIVLIMFFSSFCFSKGSWEITSSSSTEGSVFWKANKVNGGAWDDYEWDDDSIKRSCESAHELMNYSLEVNRENYSKMGLVNSGHEDKNWMKIIITKDCEKFTPTQKPNHVHDGTRGFGTTIYFDLLAYSCDGDYKYSGEGSCSNENNDNDDLGTQCKNKPSLSGQYNNVYNDSGDRYIYVDGCQYEATGVIVCNSEGTECAADWKPTGFVADESDNPSEPTNGNGNGNGNGNDNNGGTGSENNITHFDYQKNAQAIRQELTEKINDHETNTTIKNVSKDLTKAEGLLDGLSESVNGLVGNGGQVGSEFTSASEKLQFIGNNVDDSILTPFISSNILFPSLPNPKACESLIFGKGQIYQFSIDCKYINLTKTIFSFILYFLTAWYFINTLTGLNRKGVE